MKELIFADLAKHQFPKSLNGKKIVFIGHTSVGKSSLLNTLFGTKLPTSKGPCTKKV
jgi:GTP-binding protein EngB required for normal cell division